MNQYFGFLVGVFLASIKNESNFIWCKLEVDCRFFVNALRRSE
jgi:hypothetical protein